MPNNPFLKRLMKDQTEDVLHSSAYAEAQNKGIGTASTESFSVRRQIDQNRTSVRGYDESKIVTDAQDNTPRPKEYTKEQDKFLNREDNVAKRDYVRDKLGKTADNEAVASKRAKFSSSSPTPSRFDATRTAPPPPRKNPGIFR